MGALVRGIHHKLGIVLPANNSVLEPELWPRLPANAALHTARILVRGDLTPQMIEVMEAQVDRAVDELVATGVDLIAYADMVTTFIMRDGWNRERSSEIERSTGLPCISAWTAMERALSAIGARRIGVGGPYPATIHARAIAYFRKMGFDVVADATLDVLSVRAVPEVSRESVIALADSIARPQVDAVVLLATDLPTFDAIEAIEAGIGRPVLSCNQTILWAVLLQRGLAIAGPGRLFKHQAARREVVR
jgi:maleate cis-trans isomerase